MFTLTSGDAYVLGMDFVVLEHMPEHGNNDDDSKGLSGTDALWSEEVW